MQLRVNYRVDDDRNPEAGYHAIVRLIHDGSAPEYIPEGISSQTIEYLAQAWHALQANDAQRDDNATLCAGHEALKKTRLLDLENRITFSSRNPIELAAVVQRIKRACAFAARATYYEAMFSFQHEEVLEALTAVDPQPTGRPKVLPDIPEKVSKYLERNSEK